MCILISFIVSALRLMLLYVNRPESLPIPVTTVNRFSMFASTHINSSMRIQASYWLRKKFVHLHLHRVFLWRKLVKQVQQPDLFICSLFYDAFSVTKTI
jgi:hypothetical protein